MKLSLSTLFVLLTFTGIAQVNFVNRSLTIDTLSVVYAGMDNEIEISNYSPKSKTTVTTSTGYLTSLSPNRYLVRPSHDSTSMTIAIREKNKTVAARRFAVHTMPAPVAIIPGIADSIATVEEILSAGMLRVDYPHCFYRHNDRITQFNVTIHAGGSDDPAFKSDHYIFPPKLASAISKLKKGDELVFDNIRMMTRLGDTVKLPPFVIRIK